MKIETTGEQILRQQANFLDLADKTVVCAKSEKLYENELVAHTFQGKFDDKDREAMSITNCPHPDRKHYAKGMCNYCYNLNGRKYNATNCKHLDKKNYARGLCRQCYTNYMRRRQKEKILLFDQIRKKING